MLHDLVIIVSVIVTIALYFYAVAAAGQESGALPSYIAGALVSLLFGPAFYRLVVDNMNAGLGIDYFGQLPGWYMPAAWIAAAVSGLLAFMSFAAAQPAYRR